ncbi:hypothetical protein LY56_01248 [Roseinatronobacter thiooxidans]|uniref:Uncharacterized protein n=1 Tax=Roseinatronobacter thiooxidans TaxID=121821 RepID=A0A2W7R6J3_9RHOB|nr:hypothetical protein LY56_01248 [Roseinatronobacter thiooxidans]
MRRGPLPHLVAFGAGLLANGGQIDWWWPLSAVLSGLRCLTSVAGRVAALVGLRPLGQVDAP